MSGLTFMRCDECNGFGFFPNGDRCGICNGYGSLPIRAVESASPPRVPGPSAQFAKVGVQSGPGQPIDYERGYRAGVEAAALTASAIALAPVGRIRDTATISCYERGEQMRAAIIAAIRALADKPALSDKGG